MSKTWENILNVFNKTRRLTTILFIIYLIALFWILLFKLGVQFSYMGSRSINFIPFSGPSMSQGKAEIISNVVIFIPTGIYAGALFNRWNFGRKLFFFFFISLVVECLQFTFAIGLLDITDIITNTSGGIIGYFLFQAIEKVFKNSSNAQKFINIAAVIGTVVMILLLLLLKLNMLPIRYQ